MKVSASILAAPLAYLGESVSKLDPNCIDFIHMDIMDGHFVPQLTFGEGVSQAISKRTKIPQDIHLMVTHPEKEIPKYFPIKPHNITFHYEATKFPIRLSEEIRRQNILAGISINPSTPTSVLKDILSSFDLILLMSVEPGFYGQKFLPSSFSRLEELIQMKKLYNPSILIEVDGGINKEKAMKLKNLGVDIVVSGSFLFEKNNPNEQSLSLK